MARWLEINFFILPSSFELKRAADQADFGIFRKIRLGILIHEADQAVAAEIQFQPAQLRRFKARPDKPPR